jgi:hypothetical protein
MLSEEMLALYEEILRFAQDDRLHPKNEEIHYPNGFGLA